jgi:SAM-dependent methyltransferase
MKTDNEAYWDEHASHYDALYTSLWWIREDNRINTWLIRLSLPTMSTVLDIGRGTGFVLRQLATIGIKSRYFGVDISSGMIKEFHPDDAPYASLYLIETDIADYQWPYPAGPDLITSIYCPLSFSEHRWSVIRRLAATQQAGDKLFIMLLNRYSLRRLLHLELGARGSYKARESNRRSTVEVFYDRPAEIRAAIAEARYQTLFFTGDGPLTGVLEATPLWQANAWLGKISTAFRY